ncbi:hypothetical protein [uncultured Deinococcus sp.]|nr:hypothetical protein [uncultured Deinococcus sp.]
MTRLRGKKGGLPWLWIIVAVIVAGLGVLGLDYLDIWQLGLY